MINFIFFPEEKFSDVGGWVGGSAKIPGGQFDPPPPPPSITKQRPGAGPHLVCFATSGTREDTDVCPLHAPRDDCPSHNGLVQVHLPRTPPPRRRCRQITIAALNRYHRLQVLGPQRKPIVQSSRGTKTRSSAHNGRTTKRLSAFWNTPPPKNPLLSK